MKLDQSGAVHMWFLLDFILKAEVNLWNHALGNSRVYRGGGLHEVEDDLAFLRGDRLTYGAVASVVDVGPSPCDGRCVLFVGVNLKASSSNWHQRVPSRLPLWTCQKRWERRPKSDPSFRLTSLSPVRPSQVPAMSRSRQLC